MKLRTRGALSATAMSLAALASAGAAQAQPAACSTRMFRAIDRAIVANPRPVASQLSRSYRFAPRLSLAEFDTLAQCDPAAALSVYNALQNISPNEASGFKANFARLYPTDATNVFGEGAPVVE